MSLYNTVCGENPHADKLLGLLGITREQIPRYRDCYARDGKIVVLTRTGGKNRAEYRNAAFTVVDYVYRRTAAWRRIDADDTFDSTFAHWHFYLPPAQDNAIGKIEKEQGYYDPMTIFQQVLADIKANKDTPAVRRSLELGRKIFEQLEQTPPGKITIIET